MKDMLLFSVLLLVLTSCTMKLDRSKFQELHKNEGSENYEIIELFDNKFETTEPMLDSIGDEIVVYGKTNPLLEKDFLSRRIKISLLGNIVGKGITNASLKEDGSLHGSDFYSNWIITGDTVKYRYLDPFSNKEIDHPYEFNAKEKNPEKWMKKFKEIYAKAHYVYIDVNAVIYYFKIENKWYLMEAELEGLPENLEKQYPPKKNQDTRMLELKDLSPDFSVPPEERNIHLVKEVGYESTYEEEVDKGVFSYGFSAGWWYLEINMPFGDPIRIKRYSDFKSPNLQLYKIPAAYGGRNDVLFIVQKPEELFPEQVGGMYVIRPRNAEQPERRYKSISYGDTTKGQPHILRAEETEEYKQWKEKG